MSEIWNLSSLCRCCHSDGNFKTLNLSYTYNGQIESYADMLQKTFNINLAVPSISASNMICDACIKRLRDAALFKEQVLHCEHKFEEYVKNEIALLPQTDVKEESFEYEVKLEGANASEELDIKIEFEDPSKIETEADDQHSDMNYEDDSYLSKNELNEATPTNPAHETRQRKKISDEKGTKRKKNVKTKQTVKANRSNTKNKRKFKTNLIKCELCLKYFDRCKMKVHVDKEHTKPYCCRYCELQYNIYKSLKKHMMSHEMQYNCKICNKRFKFWYQLDRHINTHKQHITFQCDMCNKEFLTKGVLIRHIRIHMGTFKRFVCEECGRVFKNRSNLTAHFQTIHEKLRIQCQMCPKRFASKKTFKIHLRLHTGELPYVCEICQNGFRSCTLLKNHRKLHCESPPKIRTFVNLYQCKHCHEKFDHRGLYRSHLKTHPQAKKLICEQCGKGFVCPYALKRHIFSHSGIKRFSCDQCSKKFTEKFRLQRHVLKNHDIHDKIIQKFKCGICSKEVQNLKQHLKCHNERRFVCKFCNKNYPERNGLNRHISESHNGPKQYGCEFCSKRYMSKKSLRRHKCKEKPEIE